jgi:hypothetical protein
LIILGQCRIAGGFLDFGNRDRRPYLEPQLLFKFPVACVLTRGNQSFDIPEGVADIRLLYSLSDVLMALAMDKASATSAKC